MILRHGSRLRARACVACLCGVFGAVAVLACGGVADIKGAKQGQSGGASAVGLGGSSSVLGSGNSGNAVGGTASTGVGATPGSFGGSSASGGSFSASGGSSSGDGSGGSSSGGVTNVGGGVSSGGGSSPGGPSASCQGLPATCGPQETEDCCASPLLPGGMFYRGEITDDGAPATLSAFRLDRFEVSVGRYRKFVDGYDAWRASGHPSAQEGAHLNAPGTGWNPAWDAELAIRAPNAATLRQNLACDPGLNTWSDAPGAHETRPVGCVNWYQAFAFCIWDGGYLPTEAEFNFAQTGGDARRYLPWSSPPSAEQYERKYASYECAIDNGLESCIFKVGAHPLGDGRFGQADLGGNVWEWTLDYEVDYPTPCQDCTSMLNPDGPASEGRILRGGGWSNGSSGMRAGYRIGHNPQTVHGSGIGFRCARVP